jgi:hypothetical protein
LAKAAQLEIEIIAKAEKAIAEMDKVKTSSGDSFGGMKAAALGAGIAVAGALVDATKAAMDHETHVAKLEQAYKNAGLPVSEMKKALEDNDAAARRTGQSANDLDDAYTKLVTATKDTTKAHEELGVAQDLAAFKGVSVADASDALIKANEGNTKALKAMGIATTDASGKQLDAKTIVDNLTSAVHGQADAYGKTSEGGLKRFSESTDQLKTKLGEALLPAINDIINALMPLFNWMNNNQQIMSVVVPIVGTLAVIIGTVVAVTRVWAIVQAALNVVMDANPIGLVILAVAGLVAGVILAYQHFKPFHEAVDAVWSVLKDLGAWIANHWQLIVDMLLGPLGIVLTNLGTFKKLANDIWDALKKVGQAASDAFGWLGKVKDVGGGIIGKGLGAIGLSAPGGGPAATPVMITVYATPGDSLPEVVYDALRSYQRRHARPELRSLFG